MKFSGILFSLLLFSQVSFAVTAAEQAAGLKAAGVSPVGGGFFARGTLAVQVLNDGSFNFLVPFDNYVKSSQIKAISVGKLFGGSSDAIFTYSVDETGRVSAIGRAPGGSGGGLDKEVIPPLEALTGTPFSQQLSSSGFQPVGSTKNIWGRSIDGSAVVVVLGDNSIVGIYKDSKKELKGKTKGTLIVGYTELKREFGNDMDSALIVQNDMFKFTIVSDIYGGTARNFEFLKDLKDIDLKDLGLLLPPVKKDTTGFQIGGVNPTSMVIGLASINGESMDEIANKAREVPGCSHGDPLLASGENLAKIMAEDNDKVKKLGLTHQDLAKPLLYAQALVDGGYTYDKFTLHGTQFEVSRLMAPMCGSLESPFNDKYGTSIMFPRITNLKTNATLDYSYLHPYLINQYGFYGSHENQSYVSPESIIEVFDFLRQQN
jgi:hypothetical protein